MIHKTANRRHQPYYKFSSFLKERGIGQKEVAELLGKSKSALNQNINGTGGDFSISEVRLICNTYKISSDEFFINNMVSN
ncbi:MAG: cro/C1-type DNA-binding domain protein [Clostridia bacterium]|jgi:transcriptional regulator with XRE-family HTH domain|nr:cro/C1-type DNA-binding domain protein [Clostridia bacterium]